MDLRRRLLQHAIDYAGLFPPAALPLAQAVAAYEDYRRSADVWALGRFVVPASRLGELAGAGDLAWADGPAWPLALIGSDEPARDLAAAEAFAARVPAARAVVEAYEFRALTVDAAAAALDRLPRAWQCFVELPLPSPAPPPPLPAWFEAVRRRGDGTGVKLRTGGVTSAAFPAPDALLGGLRSAVDAGVPFKCTAGLHHPVRGCFPLTYQANSSRGEMYGYLNVLLATAALLEGGPEDEARAILLERDARAFVVGPTRVAWCRREFSEPALTALRRRFLGFGSCSFREPLEGLHQVAAAA